jgi:hypothetical protein
MTTDLLDLDTGVDFWEAATDEEAEAVRCGCADCRALRGGGRRAQAGDGGRDD